MDGDSIKFPKSFDAKANKYFITCEKCNECIALEINTPKEEFDLITKHVYEVHGYERGNLSRSNSD
jgi:transcription elongation factor Elf1